MKFSMHARTASPPYLKKVDEIVVGYRDRRIIPDYAKKYPAAWVVLEVTPETQWEISEIKDYYILAKQKLKVCLPDIRDERVMELKEAGIPYFWGYTITTFWDLNSVIAAGVSEVRIGAPLFFQCDKLQQFDVKKRVWANIAHEGYFPIVDWVVGPWLRPEDVELYDDTFDTIEFGNCKDKQEEALYRIYAEQKHWPGKLDMIITNVNTEAYNRLILEEFAEARKNCGQRCMSGGACRVCYRALNLADRELLQDYKENIEEKAGEEIAL